MEIEKENERLREENGELKDKVLGKNQKVRQLKNKVKSLNCEGCEECPENSPYQKFLKRRKKLEKENKRLREKMFIFKKAWLDGIDRYEY